MVLGGSAALGTVTFDQRQTPADFFENGVGWQDLGNVQFIGDTRVVQLTDEAGPPGSFVVADAVRMERVGGAPVEPEIEVTVDGVDLPDGTGSVSFPSTKIGKPKTKTITVQNVGLLDLSLGTITVPYGSACWQTSARRYWHPARRPALSCNSMRIGGEPIRR